MTCPCTTCLGLYLTRQTLPEPEADIPRAEKKPLCAPMSVAKAALANFPKADIIYDLSERFQIPLQLKSASVPISGAGSPPSSARAVLALQRLPAWTGRPLSRSERFPLDGSSSRCCYGGRSCVRCKM